MTGTASPEPRVVILDAARGVLGAVGYRGFTIEAVAARAGVDRAAVDRWWTGAGALLIDVLAETVTVPEISDLGDSRRELAIAVSYMVGLYTDWHRFEPALLAFAADHAGDDVMLEQLRQRCVQRGRDQLDAVLRRAAARGDLPPDVDTDLVQDVWAGTIAYRRLVSGGSLTVALVEPLLDLVLSGMAPVRAPDWPTEGPRYEYASTQMWEGMEWLQNQFLGRVHPLGDGVPVEALAAVPHTATIVGHDVTIEANASRDFMPIVDANSTALTVHVTVAAAGTGVLPPFLRADRIAVVHDDEVWVAPVAEEYPRGRTSRSFKVLARQGPEWEPGSTVDIVIQVRTDNAAPRLIRAAKQRIDRTD